MLSTLLAGPGALLQRSLSTRSSKRSSKTSYASSAMSSTCFTNSTNSSRITSSERSFPEHWQAAIMPHMNSPPTMHQPIQARSLAQVETHEMLSAVDRKRKQGLPRAQPADVRVTQASPSETLNAARGFSTSFDISRMLPRGPTEREDFTGLRDFCIANPATLEDIVEDPGPVSAFGWDSDDDSTGLTSNFHLANLKRAVRQWQAVKKTDSSKTMHSPGLDGLGSSVDEWMEHAKMYAEGCGGTAANGSAVGQKMVVNLRDGATIGPIAISSKRSSAYNFFDNSFWSPGNDISNLIANGIRNPSNDTNSNRPRQRERDIAAAKVEEGPTEDHGQSDNKSNEVRRPKALDKTVLGDDVPEASYSTSKTEAKLEWLLGPESLPNGFRCVDWSREGRGISAINSSDCAPSNSQVSKVKDSEPVAARGLHHKTSKTSLLQKFKSPLFESGESASDTHKGPSPPHSARLANTPKFPIPLRRGASAENLCISDISDPFVDISSTETSSPKKLEGDRRSVDEWPPRPKSAHITPSKEDKRTPYAPWLSYYPHVAAFADSCAYKRQPLSSPHKASPKADSEALKYLNMGYPTGPESPIWDDAVRYAKQSLRENEKREAEDARQKRKEDKKKERRLKKLRAGRDLVMRGSQLSLVPNKPLDDITEDEFETIGEFATNEKSTAKKSSLFSALFSKIVGTDQEKTEQAAQIKRKLERHKSLEVLNIVAAHDTEEPPGEIVRGYEKALRALNGAEVNPFAGGPDGSSYDSSAGTDDRLDSSIPKRRDPLSGTVEDNLPGLRISTTDSPPVPKRSEYRAPVKSTTYQEFLALKRQRDCLADELDNSEDTIDASALSDIAEEDAETRANGVHAQNVSDLGMTRCKDAKRVDVDDDASSWCTESINSIDQVEDEAVEISPTAVDIPDQYTPHNGAHSLFSVVHDNDADSVYSDKVESDAVPPPLNIRILKVKQSSVHIQPPQSNSFIPDRKASFHDRIRQVSRLQEAHIGGLSHPALRFTSETREEMEKSSISSPNLETCGAGIDVKSKRDSIDSGFESMPDETTQPSDAAYTTAYPQKNDLTKYSEPRSPSKRFNESSRGGANSSCDEGSEDIDLVALRAEVGLGALRIVSSSNSPRHPHHPFTWDHQKIMCRGVHNREAILSPMPSFQNTESKSPIRTDSEQFSGSPTKTNAGGPKVCQSCGAHCCRFANSVVTSKIVTGGDLLEEKVRYDAERRVEMLRAYHPNGVEEYDTFLQCQQCERSICPKCAKMCSEERCRSVNCLDCLGGEETCSNHHAA